MSPATAASPLPTRSEVESWSVDHLESAAQRWPSEANKSEQLFGRHVRNLQSPGGTEWTGAAAEAAVERGHADLAVVRRQGDVLREAGTIAANGAQDQRTMQRAVLDAIAEAEQDGFKVNDDLSVTDSRSSNGDGKSRQTAAQQHTEYIHWRAAQLIAGDDRIGQQLHAKAAELQRHKFDGNDSAEVQAMDYHDQPPTPEPTPPPTKTAKDVHAALDPLPPGDGKSLTRDVRKLPSSDDVRDRFRSLTEGAPKGPSNYPGDQRMLSDGTLVGLRDDTGSGGPGIDVKYPDGSDQFVHVSKDGLAAETAAGPHGGGGGVSAPESSGGGARGGGGLAAGIAPPAGPELVGPPEHETHNPVEHHALGGDSSGEIQHPTG